MSDFIRRAAAAAADAELAWQEEIIAGLLAAGTPADAIQITERSTPGGGRIVAVVVHGATCYTRTTVWDGFALKTTASEPKPLLSFP